MLEALSGTGLAPEFCAAGRFEGLHWLLYHHIEGGPWRGNTAKVAEILGGLHQLNVGCDLPLGANGSADLAAQTQIILNASGISSDEFFYRPKAAVPATDRLCLIHGDPVPGNIVVQQNRMVLIDWQCPKLGDPAEDLALFLSPAMQVLYGRHPLSADEVQSFIAAYPKRDVVERLVALQPWYHWRMASYCLWRGDRKAAELELAALGQSRS